MATLNAIFVPSAVLQEATPLLSAFTGAERLQNDRYCGLFLPEDQFRPPEDDLRLLSATLNTHVFWLGFQSTAGAIRYHHWRSGDNLRSLVFGYGAEPRSTGLLTKLLHLWKGDDEEPKWERVEGFPEPWEQEAFFSERQLAFEKTRGGVDAEEMRRVEQIWREKEVRLGESYPYLDGRELGVRLAKHYGFPGWEDSEDVE